MPGQRQPYREMAADGSRAENTDTHEGMVSCCPVISQAVSTSEARRATAAAPGVAAMTKSDRSTQAVPA
jgi:hypothetical protein